MARRRLTSQELREIREGVAAQKIKFTEKRAQLFTTGQEAPGGAEIRPRTVSRRTFEESLSPEALKQLGLQRRREGQPIRGLTDLKRRARARERGIQESLPQQDVSGLGGLLGLPTDIRQAGGVGVGTQFLSQLLDRQQAPEQAQPDQGILRINQEADAALQSGISDDVVEGFRTSSMRGLAIQRLTEANQRLTENNITEIMRQLQSGA